jgi:hypothetical protein
MAKKKSHMVQPKTIVPAAAQPVWKRFLAPAAIILMLGAAGYIFLNGDKIFGKGGKQKNSSSEVTNVANAAPGTTTTNMGLTGEPVKMTVAQAVMVTVDLDFGGAPMAIADAIQQVERGYQPDDGQGRTFAILDAYGEPQPDGKLRMSMHVSSEKPGLGTLKFKRTGELLWRARIGNPGDSPAGEKRLTVYLNKGLGNRETYVLDALRGGTSVMEIFLQGLQQRVRDVWPEGAEREITFVYSACGCPVKVMCRRAGDRTVRTSPLPVIFPDDPAAVATISSLMKW